MNQNKHARSDTTSRRGFLKTSGLLAAGAAASGGLSIARTAHAQGSGTIKIALVGAGGRGTGAAVNALSNASNPNVKLWAIADAFENRLEGSLRGIQSRCAGKVEVGDRKFLGLNAYQQAIDSGVDMVLLCTPPGFRPMQFEAAVKAGKHVFMEKPLCVDAPGYRTLVAANEVARQNKLSVVVGLQRRHQQNYLEKIKQIRDGRLGTINLLRTYFNMPSGGRSGKLKPEGISEMEYQVRHWGVFCWLCGDHLVEQATHEIDVANWIMDAHPVRANGMGGRQVRIGPGNGDIWDHHFIEFQYANGVRFYCQARQQPGTWSHVSDNVHGTNGEMTIGTGAWGLGAVGPREMRSRKHRATNPYQQEHQDLAASILGDGPYRMEADYGATSTMTAVMGRMATYSGNLVTWDEATAATQRLGPKRYALDTEPPVLPLPDGSYPSAMPGISKVF